MNTTNELNKKFYDLGYKFTRPRKLIMDVLLSTKDHLSVEDIFFEIHEKCPNIGITTIYRTLDLLLELDIVCKFDFGDGRTRYELVGRYSDKPHHHHLICIKCKTIIDYSDFVEEELHLVKQSELRLSKKYNFNIKDHIIHFLGICAECNKQEKSMNLVQNKRKI